MRGLISLSSATEAQAAAVPKRRSAGLAWLLSVVLPGAGHVYAGLYLRAALVFGFSLLGLFALGSVAIPPGQGDSTMAGALVFNVPVLWVFGFLDAYMTTAESNRGIDPTTVDNPRVAAVLNLTTKGLGYFYLGERAKGITLFVVMTVVPYAALALPHPTKDVIAVLAAVITIWISIDAYRIGRRSFDSQVAMMELPPDPPVSRLPPLVPVVMAAATAFVLLALLIVGAVTLILRSLPA
jgi:TM2 domain-containing membrane protein YozV